MSQEEVSRTKELPKMFAILPAFRSFYQKIDYRYPDMLPDVENQQPYISSSQPAMNVKEIEVYMGRHRILEEFMPEKPHRSPSRRIPTAERKTELTLLRVKFL